MTLKAVVTDINSVPEAVRGFYVEKDGKHVLNVEPVEGFALENVTSLKNALNSEKDARKRANEGLQAFEGIEPQAARDAIAFYNKNKDLDPEKDADRIVQSRVDAVTNELQTAFDAKFNPVMEENTALKASLTSAQLTAEAMAAITANNGAEALLMPVIKASTKAEFVDGKVKIVVLGDDGQPRIKDHQNNIPMTIGDFVTELRGNEAYGGAFHVSGGGSGTKTTRTTNPEAVKADMGGTPEQRKAALAKQHPELANL